MPVLRDSAGNVLAVLPYDDQGRQGGALPPPFGSSIGGWGINMTPTSRGSTGTIPSVSSETGGRLGGSPPFIQAQPAPQAVAPLEPQAGGPQDALGGAAPYAASGGRPWWADYTPQQLMEIQSAGAGMAQAMGQQGLTSPYYNGSGLNSFADQGLQQYLQTGQHGFGQNPADAMEATRRAQYGLSPNPLQPNQQQQQPRVVQGGQQPQFGQQQFGGYYPQPQRPMMQLGGYPMGGFQPQNAAFGGVNPQQRQMQAIQQLIIQQLMSNPYMFMQMLGGRF